MSWNAKINSKIYIVGVILNVCLAGFFSGGELDVFTSLMIMIITTVVSQYFNIRGMGQLIVARVERKQSFSSSQMLFHFALKMFFLILGLVCLMVFTPDKVLQGLILYIFQLIILALSIKNIGKFFKKGSSS